MDQLTDRPTDNRQTDQTALPLKEAARLFGTTAEALRLRVRRGTLTRVELRGSKGQKLVGVLLSELQRAFTDGPEGEPIVAVQPPKTTNRPSIKPTNQPTDHRPTNLERELARERSMREAAAETNARALAVIQDRKLAPIIEQLQQDVRSARRDARLFGLAAVLLVGGLAWYAVDRIEAAGQSTVHAQEQTIQAQSQALQEASRRALAEQEASAATTAAKQAQEAAQAAEAKLEAIAIAQRVRSSAMKALQIFR